MSEFIEAVFQAVTVGSVLTSALAGVMVGALYGYMLEPDAPPRYPFALWSVGIAFITAFAIWSFVSAAPFQPPFQVARGILWTVTCAAIPIGRLGRHLIAPRIHSPLKRRGLLETTIEHEDRMVGETRRDLQVHNDTAPKK